jgi:hypothetical protein
MTTSWLPSRCALVESSLAFAAGFLAFLAAVWPDWLESFGIRWDGGSGGLEWALPVVLALVAVFFAARARRHWRIELASSPS